MSFVPSLTLWDYGLLLATLLGAVYVYVTWHYGYFKRRGVPFVEPFPLLGNMKQSTLGSRAVFDDYGDIYQRMKGNAFCGYFKFRDPGLLIIDPDLVKTIMTKDFQSFHDNDIDITVDDDPMFGRNPFCLRGDQWKTLRGQLTPAFTPGRLKPLFPFINDVCKDLKTYLEKEEPVALEAKEVSAKFTTDCVATCAFGLNGNSFTDPNAEFRNMGRDLMKMDFWKNIKVMLLFMMPSLSRLLHFRFFNEEVTNFFRRVVKETMSYRDTNKVVRNDFLSLLMQLKAKGTVDDDDTKVDANNKFTDEDVAAQATTFFTDGFETSSITLAFALYELAANVDVQQRLREEVGRALQKHDGVLSYEMLQDVPYIDMVFNEALRKYPPAGILSRVCTRPYDLVKPDGSVFKVAVGTPVTIPILALHKDPDYYPDPEVYNPERFSEEERSARHQYTFIPFGAGPRACLGQRFAQLQIKAGIASIVTNFRLSVSEKTIQPLVMDPHSFLMMAKGGIWLNFKKL